MLRGDYQTKNLGNEESSTRNDQLVCCHIRIMFCGVYGLTCVGTSFKYMAGLIWILDHKH
jgi:hypothetical protein